MSINRSTKLALFHFFFIASFELIK